jgi:hypothetical protein
MASTVYLVSMAVMGILALLVVALTATGRDWFDYSPRIGSPDRDTLSTLASSPRAWVVLFFLLVAVVLGATLSTLGGGSAAPVLALIGLLLVGFLVLGTYAMGRSLGHPHAYAIGETVITLGALLLVVLAAYLLTSFGA